MDADYAAHLITRLLYQSREENRVMRLENEKLFREAAECIKNLGLEVEEYRRVARQAESGIRW